MIKIDKQNNQSRKKNDYDETWKDIIEDLFEDFLKFFAPDLYKKVDFNYNYEFLDKEFSRFDSSSISKNRKSDKLIRVKLKNGEEKIIFIHIEVQGYQDKDFSLRMFQYLYRIYDKYQKNIFALVIFTDPVKSFKPDRFEYKLFGTELIYKYRTYKVLEQSENKLIANNNPFAKIILTALYLILSEDTLDKYNFKLKLTKILSQENYSQEQIDNIFIFIDKILYLPEKFEERFEMKRKKIMKKEGKKVGLTWDKSNLAELYRKKGKKEGKIEGRKEGKIEGRKEGKIEGIEKIVCKLLTKKFGKIPDKYKQKLDDLTEKELELIGEKIFDMKDIKELENYL